MHVFENQLISLNCWRPIHYDNSCVAIYFVYFVGFTKADFLFAGERDNRKMLIMEICIEMNTHLFSTRPVLEVSEM